MPEWLPRGLRVRPSERRAGWSQGGSQSPPGNPSMRVRRSFREGIRVFGRGARGLMSGRWLRGERFALNGLVRRTPHLGLIIETECNGQRNAYIVRTPLWGTERGDSRLSCRAPRVLGEFRR